MKTLTAALLLTLLAGCGGQHAKSDPVLEKVHTKAPAWAATYSDTQLKEMMARVCKGDLLKREAKETKGGDEQWGYVVGLAQTQCP